METFYVTDTKGNLVPAKYLMDGNTYVTDSSWGAYQKPETLYNADGTRSSDQNPNGYLIVPANYSLQQAADFGRYVNALRQVPDDSGPATALAAMAQGFWTGHPQDLQRNYVDRLGNPVVHGDPVRAFQHAASFHLGAVTAASGIPLEYSLYGGGSLNAMRAFGGYHVDTSGIYGNNPANVNSMQSGFNYVNRPRSVTQPMQLNRNDTDPIGSTEPGMGVTQGQMTSQQVPAAAPSSPFGVPVPPALQPLVDHFFPQGFDMNNTPGSPSAGTSVDAGVQSNPAGSTGAGLGPVAGGQMTPQPFPAAPSPPFGVPVTPALLPLVEHFFPQWLDTNNAQAWPSARTSVDAGVQPNPVDNPGAGLGLVAGGQPRPQPFPAPSPSSSPFSVPVPPALLPVVKHFFPEWLDPNNAQASPSAGTSNDAGAQPNPVGNAGAGLGLVAGGLPASQPFPASPASPLDVPIPESLRPLLRLFFP